ncbi:T9SS type B sorting domain-containing protein [Chitinophaga agrisoli]|uniref:T9SS type B sorting domain-containing protein n=1 Tax=Chitinophaga agrisoli TaxID=2607653 RepID=A0A5B2VLW5_9BACT|nr:MBG domain-containing protein [Chitinophaga agrisoli]KAA2239312.1 T9SS type B sorting domain-containing protein [Chitinophaga agrisoli]
MCPFYPRPIIISLICLLLFSTAEAQITVTASAGTPGPITYTTLKASFDAINAGTHQGNIIITIDASTTEPAVAILEGSGTGAASYSGILIKPAAGATPVVSGNFTNNNPVIRLRNASNVTIDGSNNGTASKDLTLTNTGGIRSYVIQIGSNIAAAPASGITVKNTNIVNAPQLSNAAIAIGNGNISIGYFKNIAILNNSIRRAGQGITLSAVRTAGNGSGTVISGNELIATGTECIRNSGIICDGVTGITISDNKIGNFDNIGQETDIAIFLTNGTIDATVSNNTISNMSYTGPIGTFGPIGIQITPYVTDCNIRVTDNTISDLSTNATFIPTGIQLIGATGATIARNQISNIVNTYAGGYSAAGILMDALYNGDDNRVYNNFIRNVAAVGKVGYTLLDNAYGIAVTRGSFDINFNTVVLTSNATTGSASRSSAILIGDNAGGPISLRNNILVNLQTDGSNNKGIALSNVSPSGSYVFREIDHNDYYSASNILSSDGNDATLAGTLTQLQAMLGSNANSKSLLPTFVSATDLHLAATGNTGIEDAAIPLTGITDDIDKETRSTVTPDIGADERLCLPPVISTPPAASTITVGDNTSFSVAATGAPALSYQWEVNTGSGFTPLTDNAPYSNTTTPTLNITNANAGMNGYHYRCVVTNACTPPATSTDALLTVTKMAQQITFQTQTPGSVITVTYGDPPINGAATASSGLPVSYSSSDKQVAIVDAAGQVIITGAGAAVITVSQAGDNRYLPAADISITITVNKKDLYLTADDKTRPYGSPDPVLTITYSGFVNGEDASLITAPAIATTATPASLPGTYDITLSGGAAANYNIILTNGTLTITEIPVQIRQEPANGNACKNSPATFSVTASALSTIQYQWQESADNLNWQNINGAISSTYTAPGNATRYLRCALTASGMTSYSRAAQFTVYALPDVQITRSDYTDCTNSSVQLRASGAVAYTWLPAAGLSDANSASPVASPLTSTVYMVAGTDANGCQGKATVEIKVGRNYEMANAFTPDGNGTNDCFGIRSWGPLLKVSFSIYNRWGERIFWSTNPNACWDGRYQGKKQEVGTYIYYITAVTECGAIERKGTVTLIR